MKCYLHVGVEKTGTTTVQEFLHTNRDRLAEHGCLVTTAAGERNNWKLPVAAYDLEQRDDLTRAAGVVGDGDLDRLRRQLVGDLSTVVKRAERSGCRQVIFSSEHLQSRLRTDTSLKRLASVLDAIGVGQVQVVVYLRDPAALVSSLYSTMVKNGSTGWRPPGPEHPYFNRVCNHQRTIEQFQSVFGAGSVIPRIFQPQDLVGASIVDDLLFAVGLGDLDTGDMARPAPLNESLSTTAVQILRRVNQYVPLVVDDSINPARAGLVETIERNNWGSKYQVDSETVAAYRDAFASSNRWVRDRFFPQREQLFATPTGSGDVSRMPEEGLSSRDLDAVAALVTDLWVDRQRSAGIDVDTGDLDTRRMVERSGLFDAEFYLQTYPGVAEAGIDPLTHFLNRGGIEGRKPSPSFDTRAYLRQHPELRNHGVNPLVHYLNNRSA